MHRHLLIQSFNQTLGRAWRCGLISLLPLQPARSVFLKENNMEKETINIASMFIKVNHSDNGAIHAWDPVPDYPVLDSTTIAVVTVKDWQDILSGKRELIVGEGVK